MPDTTDSQPVPLRNAGLAAALALVLPGLGHFYQRRFLKSAIYFFGVLGLFGWGLGSAEGHGVYFRPPGGPHSGDMKEFIGYLAQAGVGVTTWPAVIQHRRFYDASNSEIRALREPLNAPFHGALRADLNGSEVDALVGGQLSLEPSETAFGSTLSGTFTGTTAEGREISVRVGDRVELEPEVAATKGRMFRADVLDEEGGSLGFISGAVRRPFWDWYAVPPSEDAERVINENLGTRYDLAYVVVMIAGLLNMLAAYDAFEGPALGRRIGATVPRAGAAT